MTWEHHLKLIAAEPEGRIATIAVVEAREILVEITRLRVESATESKIVEGQRRRILDLVAEIERLRAACQSVLDVINLLGRGKPIVIGLPVIRELEQALEGKL